MKNQFDSSVQKITWRRKMATHQHLLEKLRWQRNCRLLKFIVTRVGHDLRTRSMNTMKKNQDSKEENLASIAVVVLREGDDTKWRR